MLRPFLLVSLLACASTAPVSDSVPASAASAPVRATANDRWVDSVMQRLTLRDKAAQMVWPWILGDFVPENSAEWARLKALVTEQHVGGFIVSVGSPTEIAAKVNALQRLSDLPLLMSADLEYGAGFRARGPYFLPNAIDLGGAVSFPTQMGIAATGDTSLAYEMGRVTAREGRAMGIHITYAPVLDVNNNAANPVINTRSFSERADVVSRFGVAAIRGIQDNGMIATGKHFPGHGDTEINSHLAMAMVDVPRPRLDSVELPPFRAAVNAGVGAMMTFHGALPALDKSNDPATVSSPILQGILRRELGFRGLIISDAMDMNGVLGKLGLVAAVKGAVAAGVDVVLMPPDIAAGIDAIVAGVREGRYSEAHVDSSVRRILTVKRQLGLDKKRTVALDSVRYVVGDSSHVASARQAAERSITLVRDNERLVPMGRLPRSARVLSITFARRPELGAGVAFNAEMRPRFPSLRAEWMNADDPSPMTSRVLAAADSADVVIVGSYIGASSTATTAAVPATFSDFVRALVARGKRPIVVAFANPYLLQQMPDVGTYLVAWGVLPLSQQAAARALLGTNPITGRLPIGIPPLITAGSGEMRDAIVMSTQ